MTTENLERSFANTRAVVANVTREQLGDATPCATWDVRALMNHIIGGAFFFADSMNNAKPSAPSEDDFTEGDFVATYDDGIEQALAAFNAPGAMDKTVELAFGPLPAPVWMQIATTDVFMHGWDLARAIGQPTDRDPELAAQLLQGARMFVQPAFRGPDGKAPFGPEQTAPEGASPADQLAAFLGRTV